MTELVTRAAIMSSKVTGPERIRLFVAVPTADPWRPLLQEGCTRLQAAAPRFGRWTTEAGWHVTLAFLGYQPAMLVPSIAQALDSAATAHTPFSVRLSRLGCFRRGRNVSVIWSGVDDEPAGSLAKLQADVVEQLTTAGIQFERGPFQAHLTLARRRHDATLHDCELILAAIEGEPGWTSETETECSQVLLFKSDLRPTGAVYTVLHSAQLGNVPGG